MSEENEIKSIKVSLGEEIKITRTRKGMSIKELAKEVGVTAPYLARIENNVIINIGLITFTKICHELDLSDTDILHIIRPWDN